MDLSLYFFADDHDAGHDDGYDDGYALLLEAARFADGNGFSAVWTPERHFHRFGGRYPSPAVVGAAVAAVTERVAVRAGSVVGPLHHPVRIAEDWSVVDNLSRGRAGVSFASGWHAGDYVLRPENYPGRRQVLVDTVETVRSLWRGDEVELPDGEGRPRGVRIRPRPVQPELPVWITSSGTPETFRQAGRLGAGVLTYLVGQDHDTLARNIAAYREELTVAGPGVVVMLHTFVGTDRDEVLSVAREPFRHYLRSSVDLLVATPGLLPDGVELDQLPDRYVDLLVTRAADRLIGTSSLIGTVADCTEVVSRLSDIGVDEVACLLDFGVPAGEVLLSLRHLGELRAEVAAQVPATRR